jgi:hypothetical protein
MHGKRVLQWGNPDEVHTRKAKQCEVEGCIKNVDSWGYCGMHVWRLKRGLPLGGPETIYELRDKAIESIIDVGWAYNAEELMRMVPGDLKPRTILLRLKEEGAPESLVEKFYALERVRDNARRRERRAQKRANAKSG